MKLRTRILAWLAITALLLTALPLTAAADTDILRYGRSILAQMENADALMYAYDTLVEGIGRADATIQIRHKTHHITWDEAGTVFDLLHRDYPEYFWLEGTLSGSVSGDTVISLSPTYYMTGAALTAAQTETEAVVATLTAGLEGKSDYDKSLILHDRLVEHTAYWENKYDQSAYSALKYGYAVCAGYARAYQWLLNRVGIPAWYVTGYSVNVSTSQYEAHGWNLVQLDGEWYYTDVTWADQKSYTFYAYFNVTAQSLRRDHVTTSYVEYLPAATSTAHNYFYRNGMVFDRFDTQRVADIFRHFPVARFLVTYAKEDFYDDYFDALYDIIENLGFPEGSTVTYGRWSLGQEVILTLTTPHTCRYAAVTAAPTCGTDGYTAEECAYDFCHNRQNETILPATGDHTYDNAQDATCNLCGAVRTVIAPSDNAIGDVNGDGRLNNRDLVLLQRHLAGWDVTIDAYAADTDGDGKLTVRDVALLQRYLCGWDVTLGTLSA